MRFNGAAYNSPQRGGSIEVGNRLGERPTVRQSKIYRANESGNAMKDLMGHGHLAWDQNQQQGVFAGQAVYDGVTGTYNGGGGGGGPPQRPPLPPSQQQQQQPPQPQPPQQQQKKRVCFGGPGNNGGGSSSCGGGGGGSVVFGGAAPSGPVEEAEYPLPGSVASCDACGQVVNRYYHCADCAEETGLFDVCVRCCGALYLGQGPPIRIDHPTHNYETHRMQHVYPPTGGG